ncbi:uncharacterized protein LOC102060498 isoform X2 [Zonotrichia albicollis]|uniref:uncharacterized protein LOC102060498 isoform X2 n=1 Tax=Zonotrichia albicollis TaxID=44394 RepID=UPI003D80B216
MRAPTGRAVCSGPRRGASACAVAGATGTQHGGLRGAPGAGPGRARLLIRQPRHRRDGAGGTVRGDESPGSLSLVCEFMAMTIYELIKVSSLFFLDTISWTTSQKSMK